MKGRTIMGYYLNMYLNLFPIYVLLLFLALSQGRPSASVKEHSLSHQPYQVQKIVEIYNKVSVRNSSDRYNSKIETTDEHKNNEIGESLRGDENTDSHYAVAHYPRNENEASHKEKQNEGGDAFHHRPGSSSPPPSDTLSQTKPISDFESFLSMNMDTQDDEDEDQSETSILDKFRVKILNELGFNVTTTSNRTFTKPQFSKEEYIRVYTEYMSNVKNRRERERDGLGATDRRKQAISRVQTFNDCSTDEATYGAEGWKRQLKFDFHLKSGNGKEYRVRRAIIELPSECRILDGFKNLTSSLTSFEDDSQRTSSEEELYEELDENNVNYADVTRIVSMWMVQHKSSPFVVEAVCSNRSSVVKASSSSSPSSKWPPQLKIVTRQISARRYRRSAQKSNTLNSFQNAKKYDGRDCSNLRHGKSCCRKSLKVKFSDLGITDEIMEPKEFDAHVCEGRCNQRWNAYSSTHAMFQHILHQNKGKKFAPRPCCTPTKLDQLDVIIIDPKSNTARAPMQLQVVNLNNAVVKECGCS